MRVLFIGDIVGKPGRNLVRLGLTGLVDLHHIDIVVANAENAAAGFGITREIGAQILGWGVDVMTSGNHIWDKKEAIDYIGVEPRLIRPANFPAGQTGIPPAPPGPQTPPPAPTAQSVPGADAPTCERGVTVDAWGNYTCR